MLVLVAHGGRGRIERAQTVEPGAAQEAADGGAAQAESAGDAMAGITQPAQGGDLFRQGRSGPARRAYRSGAPIPEPGRSVLPEAPHPLGRCLRAHVETGCSLFQREALLKNLLRKLRSTMNPRVAVRRQAQPLLPRLVLCNCPWVRPQVRSPKRPSPAVTTTC